MYHARKRVEMIRGSLLVNECPGSRGMSSVVTNVGDKGTHAVIRGRMYCDGWCGPGRVRVSVQLSGVRVPALISGGLPRFGGWLWTIGQRVLRKMKEDV